MLSHVRQQVLGLSSRIMKSVYEIQVPTFIDQVGDARKSFETAWQSKKLENGRKMQKDQ